MKRLTYIILIISLIACQTSKTVDYAIVSGSLENTNFKSVELKNLDYSFSKDIILDKDNSFNDTLKIQKNGYYRLKLGKAYYTIYLEPSFNLNLTYDSSKGDESLKFTGIGAAENNYLITKKTFNKSLKKYSDYRYLGSLNETDFLAKMDSVKKVKFDYLNINKGLSASFKKLEQKSITYSNANQLNNYQSYRRYITKDKKFNVSDGFYNYKKELSKENDNLLSLPAYASYFKSYISELTSEALKKDSLQDYSQVYLNLIADNIKNHTLKNNLLYSDAQYAITYVDDFEAYYNIFIKASTNKDNNAKITATYKVLKKVSKGNPSPQFVDYENYKGGTTSLKDLKGKFVYVDVWATWCGPCKREIPFLKKIEKAYHGKNIAFVSVSVDTKKDHSTWQKMIKDKKLGGIQLFSDNNWKSKFVTDYMIKGIPRFILIDPKGNIVSANAPRPSSPKLKTLLKEYDL